MPTLFKIETDFSSISLFNFEANLNHPKLNQMLEEGLSFKSRKMLSEKKSPDGTIAWQFDVEVGKTMPAAFTKILQGQSFSWLETSKFVPREHCIYWEITPKTKLLKFSGEGVWQLSALAKGCHRVIEGRISVDLPFVGKMIESLIVKELSSTYEKEPAIQKKFFKIISVEKDA